MNGFNEGGEPTPQTVNVALPAKKEPASCLPSSNTTKIVWCIGIFSVVAMAAMAITLAVVLTREGITEVCDESTTNTCRSSLSTNLQYVIDGCQQDIGSCSGETCDGCDENCCMANFESILESCGSDMVLFRKVTSCTCQRCSSSQLAISGRVSGDCDVEGSCAMVIKVENTEVARSNNAGFFSFTTAYPSSGDKVVFVVSDESGAYDSMTRVVTGVSRATQSYVNINVNIFKSDPPVSFSSNDGHDVKLGTSEKVEMRLEGGAFVDQNGAVYDGTVTGAVGFIDTENEADTARLSGELTTVVNGNETSMISYGVIRVKLQGENNQPLSGKMTIDIPSSDVSDPENTYLWSFDDTTGEWKMESAFQSASFSSKRRRDTAQFLTATIDVSSLKYIYNLDALMIYPYCYMQVRVLESEQSNIEINGVELTAIYKRPSGSWASYQKRTTSRWSNICINVPCHLDYRLNVDSVRVQVPSGYTVVSPNNVPTATLDAVYYKHDANSFEIKIPNDLPTSNNGPFFETGECYNINLESSSYFVVLRDNPSTETTTAVDGSGSGTDSEVNSISWKDEVTTAMIDELSSGESGSGSVSTTTNRGTP